MKITIYGMEGCSYCRSAVYLSEELVKKDEVDEVVYLDIMKEGITKEELSRKSGVPVTSVPIIFLDDAFIGGYNDLQVMFGSLIR